MIHDYYKSSLSCRWCDIGYKCTVSGNSIDIECAHTKKINEFFSTFITRVALKCCFLRPFSMTLERHVNKEIWLSINFTSSYLLSIELIKLYKLLNGWWLIVKSTCSISSHCKVMNIYLRVRKQPSASPCRCR